MRFLISASTTRGVKPFNEDRVVVGGTGISAGSVSVEAIAPCCVAVMDGVSTGGEGSLAAQLAADRLAALDGTQALAENPVDAVSRTMEEARSALLDLKSRGKVNRGAACTVSGICFGTDGKLTVYNVGDSRVYRVRAGILTQLTHDDTLVGNMKDSGATPEMIAEVLATDAHTITRALGVDGPQQAVKITVGSIYIPGDTYLVCSDGLSGTLDNELLEGLLSKGAEFGSAQTLVKMALSSGADDNVSAAVVCVVD